jgi:hypothetical protein
MKHFRILFLAVSFLVSIFSGHTSAVSVSGLVSDTLTTSIFAQIVQPITPNSPACLPFGIMDGEGRLRLPPSAREFTVEEDIELELQRALFTRFGGSGLKVKSELIMLIGNLAWTTSHQHRSLLATFALGPFNGFFNSGAPHRTVKVLMSVVGTDLCLVEH